MIINDIFQGTFMDRPNRFTVEFKKGSKTELAHLRDPGRLRELLTPNVKLLLRQAKNVSRRKTKNDVIAVLYEDRWVLINSGFHSDMAEVLIESRLIKEFEGYHVEKREFTYGKSRLDFLLSSNDKEMDKKLLLEVKGCTLVENGLAKFPDAPTKRGKRHIDELINARKEGLNAAILFLIARDDAMRFSPNWDMDPDFSEALFRAVKEGVIVVVYCFKILLEEDKLEIKPFRTVDLNI
ncbi:MAG: DNA/RNA nuclease SfsA [Methanobacterium sp.]|nr:DNA/RNA nuclease SfsA [Methanobacterium sp.]